MIHSTGERGWTVTVYLVSTGQYSDWAVRGIFSTREKAEALRVELGKVGDCNSPPNDVAEWEVDGEEGKVCRMIHSARMDFDTGDCRTYSPRPDIWPASDACEIYPGETHDGHAWVCVESPVSAEHAAKVAAEKRQEWLRSRAVTLG